MVTGICFSVKCIEVDKMGIAHHANYLKWFEAGRKDYLRKAGIPGSSINSQGFYLPLSSVECKFKIPAKYGDEITINTTMTYISCVKVVFEYKVLNKKSGNPLAVGKTVHAWTDRNIRPLNIEKAAPHIYTALKASMEATGITGSEMDGLNHKQ